MSNIIETEKPTKVVETEPTIVKSDTSEVIPQEKETTVLSNTDNYHIVKDNIVTINRNDDPDQWFLDMIDNRINGSSLSTNITDLSNIFGKFKDGVTKQITYLQDGDKKLAADLSVVKVSNDVNTAGIFRLDSSTVTAEEASAISSHTVAAWQNNGAGGAWFDENIKATSNAIQSVASQSSVLTATIKSQQDQLTNAFGSIEVLQKQSDGKVVTWFGTDKPVIGELLGGDIDPTVKPYYCWLEGNVCQEEDWEDTDSLDTRAEHTGDTYVYYELDVDGDKKILATYRFVLDSTVGEYGWQIFKDDLASEAYQAALNAADTADGKIATFLQSTPPHLEYTIDESDSDYESKRSEYDKLVGDIWYNLTDKTKMNRYSRLKEGTTYSYSWTDVRDEDLTASITRLDEATVDVNGIATAKGGMIANADGVITGYTAESYSGPDHKGSVFNIFADRFAITGSAGNYAGAPFKVNTTDNSIEFNAAVTFRNVSTDELNNVDSEGNPIFTNDDEAIAALGYAKALGLTTDGKANTYLMDRKPDEKIDAPTNSKGVKEFSPGALWINTSKGAGNAMSRWHPYFGWQLIKPTSDGIDNTAGWTDDKTALEAKGLIVNKGGLNDQLIDQNVRLSSVEAQIDGVIETHFGEDLPIKENTSIPSNVAPYSNWLYLDQANGNTLERSKHAGDTYIVTKKVNDVDEYVDTYRFGRSTANPVDESKTDADGFGFFKITDTVSAKAYELSIASGDAADGKIVNFTNDITYTGTNPVGSPIDSDAPKNSKGIRKLGRGDTWSNPSENNKQYVYTGTEWTPVVLGTEAIDPLTHGWQTEDNVQSTIASKLETYDESIQKDLEELNISVASLQNQNDGVVLTHFKKYSPLLGTSSTHPAPVEPYSLWTTKVEKDKHSGDTFVQQDEDGSLITSYRFGQTTETGVDTDSDGFLWARITNTAAEEALSLATAAGLATDGIIRQLYRSEPPVSGASYIPVDKDGNRILGVGDMWTNSTTNVVYRWDETGKWVPIPISGSSIAEELNTDEEASINGKLIKTGVIKQVNYDASYDTRNSKWDLETGEFVTHSANGKFILDSTANGTTEPNIKGALIEGSKIDISSDITSPTIYIDKIRVRSSVEGNYGPTTAKGYASMFVYIKNYARPDSRYTPYTDSFYNASYGTGYNSRRITTSQSVFNIVASGVANYVLSTTEMKMDIYYSIDNGPDNLISSGRGGAGFFGPISLNYGSEIKFRAKITGNSATDGYHSLSAAIDVTLVN